VGSTHWAQLLWSCKPGGPNRRLQRTPSGLGASPEAAHPSSSEVTVLFTPGARAAERRGVVTPLQVVAHEVTHAVAGFYRDEGLTDYMASRYLPRLGAEVEKAALRAELEYFLRVIGTHGDRPVIEASAAHMGAAEEVPEWHAYCYTKPNLAWRMFGWVFGDQALLKVIRRLHQRAPAAYEELTLEGSQGALDYEKWGEFCREVVGEVAGPAGERFYNRWFCQAYPLDYAVSDVRCARPIPLLGREDWVLAFTIHDRHRAGAPSGRETVPVVEVVVTMTPEDAGEWGTDAQTGPVTGSEAGPESGGGVTPANALKHTERIALTGDQTRVELHLPHRPVVVELDPQQWLLDYTPTNNVAEVPTPPTMAEIARSWLVGVLVLGAALAGVILFRRHPVQLSAPPRAGKAE